MIHTNFSSHPGISWRLYFTFVTCLIALLTSARINAEIPQAKKLPPLNDTYIYHGTSITGTSTTLFVGAEGYDGGTYSPYVGAFLVYQRSGDAWNLTQTYIHWASNDRLARSIAYSNGTLLAGAPGNGIFKGRAWIYEYNGSAWVEGQQIQDQAALSDGADFGTSVAIENDWIAIGAPDAYGSTSNFCGVVVVFQKVGGTWTKRQTIRSSTQATNGRFGNALSLSSGTLVVGAPSEGDNAGAIYFFDYNGSSWVQTQRFTGPSSYDYMGRSLSLDGDRVAVSVDSAPSSGLVYVYDRVDGTWVQTATLAPSDPDTNSGFGWGLHLKGDNLSVGARLADHAALNAGAAWMYRKVGDDWKLIARVTASDANTGDEYGKAVFNNGDFLFVGAPSDSDTSTKRGALYIHSLDAPSVVQIVRQNPATLDANTSAPVFRVAFTEKVTSLTTSAFSVVGTDGQSSASVALVTPVSDWDYDVTLSTIPGAYGEVRLDLSDTTGVEDLEGNPLTGTHTGNETYHVDHIAPTGTVIVNNDDADTSTSAVSLTLSASDTGYGLADMRFGSPPGGWSDWQPYATQADFTMASGLGTQTVWAQFRDLAGNESIPTSDTIDLTNQRPVVDLNGFAGGFDTAGTFNELQAPLMLTPEATLSDPDGTTLEWLRITITNPRNGAMESLSVSTAGTTITANYNSATSVLLISGTAPLASYSQVLATLAYANSSADPGTGRIIEVIANDLTESEPALIALTINPFNDTPAIDLNGGAAGLDDELTYNQIDGPLLLLPAAATLADVDNTTLQGARVRIANRPDGTSEILNAVTDGTSITATFTPASGILDLTGSDTLSQYRAVLATVTYDNLTSPANLATRSIEWSIDDGENESPIATLDLHYIFDQSGYFVDAARPDDAGDGLTWNTAKKYIQSGVDLAAADANRRNVYVRDGVYIMAASDEVVLKSQVQLLGGYSGSLLDRDIDRYETIIDGNNATAYVVFINVVSNTLLEGFAITGAQGHGIYVIDGSGNRISQCLVHDNGGGYQNGFGYYSAGGIRVQGGGVTVEYCTITDNRGSLAGGVQSYLGSPLFYRNLIGYNEATGSGGAIRVINSSARFVECIIANNEAGSDGGGIVIDISNTAYERTHARFDRCLIVGNWANGSGGAMHWDSVEPYVTNSIIAGNSSSNVGGGVFVRGQNHRAIITNTTFYRNFSPSNGSAIYLSPTTSAGTNDLTIPMTNCIFSDHFGGAAVYEGNSTAHATLSYCLFHNNLNGAFRRYSSSFYTDAQIDLMNANHSWISNNITSQTAYMHAQPSAITGTWESVDFSSARRVVLRDTGAFVGQDLAGRFINPNDAEQPRMGYIIANTDDTITLFGDELHYYQVAVGKTYRVIDLGLSSASGAIDTGRDVNSASFATVSVDYDNAARGFDGRGDGPTGPPSPGDGSDYDIGAYEFMGMSKPVVDLNGVDPGLNHAASRVIWDASSQTLGIDSATISHDNATTLASMLIVLSNAPDSGDEFFSVDVSGTSIAASASESTGTLTLTGVDTLANYQQALRTLAYRNTADAISSSTRVFSVVAFDAHGPSATARSFYHVIDPADATRLNSIVVVDPLNIDVRFTDAMSADALVPGNYQLSGTGAGTMVPNPVSVTARSTDTYRLTWSVGEMITGQDITITVSGMDSISGIPIGIPPHLTLAGGGLGIAPQVTGVTRVHANPTSREYVDFLIQFSESVNGVDTADFSLSPTGITASIVAVTGSGATRQLTAQLGAGNGTVALTVLDNNSTVDMLGNALGGAALNDGTFSAGEAYTVEHSLLNSLLYVDFDAPGPVETGSLAQPYLTLNAAVGSIQYGGTIRIAPGQSGETLRITKPMNIEAYAGPVRIGAIGGGARPAASQHSPTRNATGPGWLLYD